MSVLLPILALQALALPKPHRIDNAVAHARTDYILNKVYRDALRRRPVAICLLWFYGFARFVEHNDRRSKTSFS